MKTFLLIGTTIPLLTLMLKPLLFCRLQRNLESAPGLCSWYSLEILDPPLLQDLVLCLGEVLQTCQNTWAVLNKVHTPSVDQCHTESYQSYQSQWENEPDWTEFGLLQHLWCGGLCFQSEQECQGLLIYHCYPEEGCLCLLHLDPVFFYCYNHLLKTNITQFYY